MLRQIVGAQHLEFGNGIDTGIIQQCEVCAAVEVVRAIDQPTVLCGTVSVDRDIDLVDVPSGLLAPT